MREWLLAISKSVAMVVVAQEWLCWLVSMLALGLDLAAVFATAHLQAFFLPFVSLSENLPWRNIDQWHAMVFRPPEWDGHSVIILGSALFLESGIPKLCDHAHPFLVCLDTIFAGWRLKDVVGAAWQNACDWE